jgi:hypothetical protein
LVAARLQKLPYYLQNCLGIYLKAFSADQHGCTLLQYMDYLLLAGST